MFIGLAGVYRYSGELAIPLAINYIIYVILQLCSSTFSFLRNISESQTIHSTMKKLFDTPITITFNVTCYHNMVTTTIINKKLHVTTSRIITYSGSKDFVYYSWLDISGHFDLDKEEEIKNDKIIFIKLRLNNSYEYFDQYTILDLNVQRNQFFMENRKRDIYMDTSTTTNLPGLREFHLVKVSDKETPFFFGKCWFIFFTFIIPIAQIYKYYISKYCSVKYFDIKKLISTRYNLNDPDIKSQYMEKGPRITIHRNETNYFTENTLMHNDPPLPNENDLIVTEYNREWVDINEITDEDRNLQTNSKDEDVTKTKWDYGNNNDKMNSNIEKLNCKQYNNV